MRSGSRKAPVCRVPDKLSGQELPQEQKGRERLVRAVAAQAKNFDLKTERRRLLKMCRGHDAAVGLTRLMKYQALKQLYEVYLFAHARDELRGLLETYRKEGHTIHADVHPLLAIIRANVTGKRDIVNRWGAALRYALVRRIPPAKLVDFLMEHGIERCCKEFRKLQAQGTGELKQGADDNARKASATKAKAAKALEVSATGHSAIETTVEFNTALRRLTQKRKNMFVRGRGHLSRNGTLTWTAIRRDKRKTDAAKRNIADAVRRRDARKATKKTEPSDDWWGRSADD